MLVSALVTRKLTSPEMRVVDALAAGRFRGLFSQALLNEYRDVLRRTNVRSRHGLSEREIRHVLMDLQGLGALIEPSAAKVPAPDSKDQHVWDLLLSDSHTAVLVTGERDLLEGQP